MKSLHRVVVAVLTFLVSAVFAVISVTSAAAETSALDNTALVAAPQSAAATLTSAAGTGVGIQNVITCSIQTDNPHKSGHVPGTVNVVSRVSCTAPVSAINGIVGLFRNGVLVSSTPGQSFGSSSLTMNTATACVNGRYDALGVADIYAPPGYFPPVVRIAARSNLVAITC